MSNGRNNIECIYFKDIVNKRGNMCNAAKRDPAGACSSRPQQQIEQYQGVIKELRNSVAKPPLSGQSKYDRNGYLILESSTQKSTSSKSLESEKDFIRKSKFEGIYIETNIPNHFSSSDSDGGSISNIQSSNSTASKSQESHDKLHVKQDQPSTPKTSSFINSKLQNIHKTRGHTSISDISMSNSNVMLPINRDGPYPGQKKLPSLPQIPNVMRTNQTELTKISSKKEFKLPKLPSRNSKEIPEVQKCPRNTLTPTRDAQVENEEEKQFGEAEKRESIFIIDWKCPNCRFINPGSNQRCRKCWSEVAEHLKQYIYFSDSPLQQERPRQGIHIHINSEKNKGISLTVKIK